MSFTLPDTITFFKMHGAGNDFVFIDNRELKVPVELMPAWAVAICRRAFGVGADGLVFLELPPADAQPKVDYRWHFYNADGSRAEMCGNAARCASLLAVRTGLAGPEQVLGTDVGPVRATVDSANSISRVEMPVPQGLELNRQLTIDGTEYTVHYLNTGVPHAVVFVPNVNAVDLKKFGPALRYHEAYQPAGTNANVAQVVDKDNILLRTWERGVEGETFACGTGATATGILANELGLTNPTVQVQTSGEERLGISREGNAVFLSGSATVVFRGTLITSAIGLS